MVGPKSVSGPIASCARSYIVAGVVEGVRTYFIGLKGKPHFGSEFFRRLSKSMV